MPMSKKVATFKRNLGMMKAEHSVLLTRVEDLLRVIKQDGAFKMLDAATISALHRVQQSVHDYRERERKAR